VPHSRAGLYHPRMQSARPARPWYRPRNILLALVALILAAGAWFGYTIYRVFTAVPGNAIDYGAQLGAVIRDAAPPEAEVEPNAWPLVEDIITRLDLVQGSVQTRHKGAVIDYTILYSASRADADQTPEDAAAQRTATLAALDAAQRIGIFDDLQKLTTAHKFDRPAQEGPLFAMLLPELGKFRNMARQSAARMYLASSSDPPDLAERERAFEQALTIARIAAQDPIIISQLVGIAVHALALAELRRELIEHPADEPTIRGLLAAMDRQLPLPPMSYALKGERLIALDTIQATYSDDGHGDGRIIPSRIASLGLGSQSTPTVSLFDQILTLGVATKAQTQAKAEEYYREVIRLADLPAPQRAADPFNPDAFAEAISRKHLVLGMLLPAISKATRSRDQIELDVTGTRLMLVLELFRIRTGAYPATLADLTSQELSEVPEDPMTGGPFGYRLQTPAEGDPRAYILYTFGADATDNGGTINPEGNASSLVSSKSSGFDYVVNEPRADLLTK
jgi:hypothetical protein